GFGERMPAKLTLRSAMGGCLVQSRVNGRGGQLTVLHCHHRGRGVLGANAISTGEDSRNAGFQIAVDSDKATLDFQAERLGERGLLLSHRLDDLIRGDHELAVNALDGPRDTPARTVGRAQFHVNTRQASDEPTLGEHAHRLRQKAESDAFVLYE